MLIVSERQRALPQLTFTPSAKMNIQGGLPLDTVLKGINIRLSGSIVTTFASGTPVADSFATLDNLVSDISVRVNGGRLIKNIRPHFLHMQQLYSRKIQGERKSSAAAAAATGNNPLVDAGFTYGTTTQTTTCAETVYLPFENTMCREDDSDLTWLNLKGRASAELSFQGAAYSALLGFGNTCPVVYSASTFVIDVETVEAQHISHDTPFFDWRQTMQETTFSGQVTDLNIPLNRGNRIQGVMMLARDGAAGSTTTASGKIPNNLLMTDIKLIINGQNEVKATNFLNLQAQNRANFGFSAPYASSVTRVDGVAYLDLLTKGKLMSALDVRAPMVDQVYLKVSTRNSTDVSYTNPSSLVVLTNELIEPQA